MNTIEQMIQEYGEILKERDLAKMELKAYQEAYDRLAQQLGMDPARLFQMEVVSCECEKQYWNFGREVVHVTFEDKITEKSI